MPTRGTESHYLHSNRALLTHNGMETREELLVAVDLRFRRSLIRLKKWAPDMRKGRILSTILLLAVCFVGLEAWAGPGAQAPQVSVTVDPRVELLSIIFRLAANPEYSQGKVPGYIQDIDRHFAAFKEDPVVKLAARLRQTQGVSFDAVMGLAVHIADARELKEAVPLEPQPASLDRRWTPASAREFLALARQFITASGFEGFINEHQTLYRKSADRLQQVLAKEGHLEWYDAFYGENKSLVFHVVLGMVNGGGSYGVHMDRADGRTDIYSILGVWQVDAQGDPEFEPAMISTIVHEFNHSYTNPLIDRFAEPLRPAAEKIFNVVSEEMKRQAYSNSKTLLYESLDRACELRYTLAYKGQAAMTHAVEYEESRSFYWVGGLAALLGEYDTRARVYPDLVAFFPRIITFFDDYARDVDALAAEVKEKKARRLQEWKEKGPRILSVEPADGATDVDPGLKAIVITFDRPMRDKSWAVMLLGDVDHFPGAAVALAYDKECRVLTIPLKTLKPDWEYTFGLNSESTAGFVSQEGIPLYPVVIRFKTRK